MVYLFEFQVQHVSRDLITTYEIEQYEMQLMNI